MVTTRKVSGSGEVAPRNSKRLRMKEDQLATAANEAARGGEVSTNKQSELGLTPEKDPARGPASTNAYGTFSCAA